MLKVTGFGIRFYLRNKITMSITTVHKTSEKVILWLHRNNKSQVWLASELGVTRQAISAKISDNIFTAGDLIKMQRLGFDL